MKTLFIGIITFIAWISNTVGGHKITEAEATRILGEPCTLGESISVAKSGGHEYKCQYFAKSNAESSASKVLYFKFESFPNDTEAQKIFTSMKKSNENMGGFESVDGIGEEAFFHSDGKNFCLLIARKQNEMIRIKVNKLSAKTSTTELKAVAKSIIERI